MEWGWAFFFLVSPCSSKKLWELDFRVRPRICILRNICLLANRLRLLLLVYISPPVHLTSRPFLVIGRWGLFLFVSLSLYLSFLTDWLFQLNFPVGGSFHSQWQSVTTECCPHQPWPLPTLAIHLVGQNNQAYTWVEGCYRVVLFLCQAKGCVVSHLTMIISFLQLERWGVNGLNNPIWRYTKRRLNGICHGKSEHRYNQGWYFFFYPKMLQVEWLPWVYPGRQ